MQRMTRACPACGSSRFESLIDLGRVPRSGLFRADPALPLPAAPLAFELCRTCGLVRMQGDPALRDYAETDRATARQIPAYESELVEKLSSFGVGPDDLVLEIGSNDGSFLEVLRRAGFRRLLGVEPSRSMATAGRERGFEVINDYFGPALVEPLLAGRGPARAAVCRHTLEHVPDPLAFVDALRRCLHPRGSIALVEVPDGSVIPERLHIDELWDEHLYCFSPTNLAGLIERAGLLPHSVETRPHLDTRNLLSWCGPTETRKAARRDGSAGPWRTLGAAWAKVRENLIDAVRSGPRPLYLLGASHRQSNFANYAGLGPLVEHFIDDDAAKVGLFPPVAGSAASVLSTAQFEAKARAGTVLLTAFGYPEWTDRICGHAARQGLRTIDPRALAKL
ncbi:MAG TPA: methyltransferase domain-containing protein [Planctomycetota bacterium]|nr:methyltransferase domain-containing protein [Planctomycetota bacterium]